MLAAAREMPTWRSRQLAASLTDHRGLSVSASTVYRILRREGLVKRIEYQLAAGKEYQHKTTGPHQLWATDASYFRVVGWGYYYLVTVMDDYSRFILAWKVQRDITADSLIEVVQQAVDSTGMTDVPLEDRTQNCPKPLTPNILHIIANCATDRSFGQSASPVLEAGGAEGLVRTRICPILGPSTLSDRDGR